MKLVTRQMASLNLNMMSQILPILRRVTDVSYQKGDGESDSSFTLFWLMSLKQIKFMLYS